MRLLTRCVATVMMGLFVTGTLACSGTTVPQSPNERVIMRMHPRFWECFQKEYETEEPPGRGEVTVRTVLEPDGTVERADAVNVKGISFAVADCIANVVRTARFEPPHGVDRTIHIPVKFNGP